MQKDREVAVIDLQKSKINDNACPLEIKNIIDEQRLPFSVLYATGNQNMALWSFLSKRAMPDKRVGHNVIKKAGKINNLTTTIINDCHCLSMSDQYWIKKEKEKIKWADINYFTNGYSYDVGNVTYGISDIIEDRNSPDLTTLGNLPKAWRYEGGKHYLYKQGTPQYYQEVLNEYLATQIAKEICKCDFVEYDICNINGIISSKCESFLTEDTMLVTAYELMSCLPRAQEDSVYKHLTKCCKHFCIQNYKNDLNAMTVFDYIINNEDRHLNNFGFIYNVETQCFEKMAPLFDNGDSLWYKIKTSELLEKQVDISKCFELTNLAQIEQMHHIKEYYSQEGIDKIKDIISKTNEKLGYHQHRIDVLNEKFNIHLNEVVRTMNKVYEKEQHQERKKQKERGEFLPITI